MKWEGNRESDNVEDRRDGRGGGSAGGNPLGGLLGGRSIGVGTIVVALLGGWIFGINPLTVLGLLTGGGPVPQVQSVPPALPGDATRRAPANDGQARFVSTVLADTEDVWKDVFAKGGSAYQEPRLVLFRGRTGTGGCGAGEAAMGPFYCPADQKVYIDLGFYDTLTKRLGAPGDFAQAYVIAHEVGHHVQNLLGISAKVEQMRSRASPAQANALSARQVLEQGDVEEAMNAAAKIGDDALQRAQGGAVVPESFTHGTSAQRQRWFGVGLQQGSVKACDTFSARNL